MKKLTLLLLIGFVTIGVLSAVKTYSAQGQTDDCKCVSDALADIEKIKSGGTREDVENIFTSDGGLSLITEPRYIYRKCNSIKVDVTYEFVDKGKKTNPKDKITAISKPYLEHSFID